MTYTTILLALAILGGLCGLLWKLIAIGCEEPLVNQRRKAWWNQ